MASVQEIYNEIDRINQAKGEIAGAIGEKGVDVPEQAKINEYPGYVRQIQQGSPDAVLYIPQELTPEQQAQARQNIGATAPEIFWATYGTTTKAEIDVALAAGKAVMSSYNNRTYILGVRTQDTYFFFAIQTNTNYWLRLNTSNDAWTNGNVSFEQSSNKSQSVPTDRASTTKYPSVKAVFDSLGKWGIVSQTQTWTGTDATGYDYTMSNLVYGMIPQSNIDLYTAAGATFNETTGYFELNELTDISYNEMRSIYDLTNGARSFTKNMDAKFAYCQARTALPIIQPFPTAFATQISTMIYQSKFESIGFDVIGVSSIQPFNVSSAGLTNFANTATRLKKLIGEINVNSVTNASYATTPFTGCYSLEDIRLKNIKLSFSFDKSSRLSLASVVYMVTNAANTSAITITLHATAYARCQADTTEYTYNGQTYTGIIAYAAAKNITIASA